MKCLYCSGEMKQGTTAYVINRDGYHLTIDNLVAFVCSQCGEVLLDETAVEAIQQLIAELDARLKTLRRVAA